MFQKGITFVELLILVSIFGVIAVILVSALKAAGQEYVILEAPTYTSGNDANVKFKVRQGDNEAFMMGVPVESVEVSQRPDSEKHASLLLRGANFDKSTCQSATILVPKEDIVAWQAEVSRWKALRKPPHVVPKPQ